MIGAVPGIVFGVLLYARADPDVFRLPIGTVAGFTSFISHAGRPPAAVYLLARGHSKTVYQATTAIVSWAVNLMKFVPYAALGIFSRETLWADLFAGPGGAFGSLVGSQEPPALPERAFFGLTYLFLVLAGFKLIFDALV